MLLAYWRASCRASSTLIASFEQGLVPRASDRQAVNWCCAQPYRIAARKQSARLFDTDQMRCAFNRMERMRIAVAFYPTT